MSHSKNAFLGVDGAVTKTDEPVDMLSASHDRIRRQCRTLIKLQAHIDKHGADDQAQRAASRVMRYFDEAVVLHHEDEEQDVFPALTAAATAVELPTTLSLCARLTQEHAKMGYGWQNVREHLEPIAKGEKHHLPQALVLQFTHAYEKHTDLEDRVLLPLVRKLLGVDQLTRIINAMRARRGLSPA
ncbi:MAG: hemerythrin domain-containing protein [Orrella sp.]